MDKEVVVQWNIIQLQKTQGNPTICCSVGGRWRHYAKGNKFDKERQVCMISLICQIYKQKTKHQAYRKRQDFWLQEVAGVGGCGVVEVLEEGGQRHKLPVTR